LIAVAPTGGGFRAVEVSLPEGVEFERANLATRGRPPTVLMFADNAAPTVIPRLDGERIALELYEVGADFQPVRFASSRNAFAWSLDGGTLKIFDR
jgi:hypothetical protein